MEEKKEAKKQDIRKEEFKDEVSVPFSKFPIGKWMEWWDDCKKNYGGCRWAKAYLDHQKARDSEENAALWSKIAELEGKLGALLKQPEEPEGIKNLAGEIIE